MTEKWSSRTCGSHARAVALWMPEVPTGTLAPRALPHPPIRCPRTEHLVVREPKAVGPALSVPSCVPAASCAAQKL